MPSSSYDYLIIGAGPAGLQLGYFLQKSERTYLIVEVAESPGSFYASLPRHGKMISINKIYTGYDTPETRLRYDWNSLLCDNPELLVRNYSSLYFPWTSEYKWYLEDFALHYQLNISYRTRITEVTKQNDGFVVSDQTGKSYLCKSLIVATGLGLNPYIPEIPGIELGEHYLHYSIDPEDYKDQRVLIIGKGNAAFETANALAATARMLHLCSPTSVKMAWETHFMGHVRTVNTEFIDTYYLKGQNALLDARIEKLERCPEGIVASVVYSHASGQTMQILYDRVLLCTGFRFDTSIFDDTCHPELTYKGKLPAMTCEWESTNVKNLYFAGTLTQMRDYQKTMSNVVHGFRFNTLFLSQLLAYKYYNAAFPYHEIRSDVVEIAQYILKRFSETAALFLQPGFFCDLLVLLPQAQKVHCFANVPLDYVYEKWLEGGGHYYTLSLEYGHYEGSPRHMVRDPDPNHAHDDIYLHPVVRHFIDATQVAELHLPENLENSWLPGKHAFIRTTEVPGKFSAEDMLGYDQQLLAFLHRQLALL